MILIQFLPSLHHLRDRLVGHRHRLVDWSRPGPGDVRQDDPRVLHGLRPHQLHVHRRYQLHVHQVLVPQVVVINFWIHILTPLLFMLCLCCTKICPFLGHCTYWNVMKVFSYSVCLPFLMFLWQGAIDMWTRPVRITIVRFFLKICIGGFSKSLRYSVVAVPLGLSMISVGGHSLQVDSFQFVYFLRHFPLQCISHCILDDIFPLILRTVILL